MDAHKNFMSLFAVMRLTNPEKMLKVSIASFDLLKAC